MLFPVRRRSAGGSRSGAGSAVARSASGEAAAEDAAPLGPAREPRAQEADAFDARAQLHATPPAPVPNTRLQLEPPKPNELLIARATGRRWRVDW